MTAIEKLKVMVKSKSNEDPLLNLLLDKASSYVLNYTRRTVIPETLESVQVDLAVIYYNRIGIEGEQGRTEGGIARTIYVLNNDMPKSITDQLNPFRKVKVK